MNPPGLFLSGLDHKLKKERWRSIASSVRSRISPSSPPRQDYNYSIKCCFCSGQGWQGEEGQAAAFLGMSRSVCPCVCATLFQQTELVLLHHPPCSTSCSPFFPKRWLLVQNCTSDQISLGPITRCVFWLRDQR